MLFLFQLYLYCIPTRSLVCTRRMPTTVVGLQPCPASQRDFLVVTETNVVRVKGDQDDLAEVKAVDIPDHHGGSKMRHKVKVSAGRAVTKTHREAG